MPHGGSAAHPTVTVDDPTRRVMMVHGMIPAAPAAGPGQTGSQAGPDWADAGRLIVAIDLLRRFKSSALAPAGPRAGTVRWAA